MNPLSKGVLLFSFNNEGIDYSKIARECAARVRTHLGLPVTIVTDKPIEGENCVLIGAPKPNRRHYPDYKESLSFLNGARHTAFDHSPYDQTLVIDTDYLIQSDTLGQGFNSLGLKLTRRAEYIDGQVLAQDVTHLGTSEIPMYWATVIFFDRSDLSRAFFRSWHSVMQNWDHWAAYLRLPGSLVRNDFAVTLALRRLFPTGVPSEVDLPLTLHTLPYYWSLTDLRPLKATVDDGTGGLYTTFIPPVDLTGLDVHVINKKSLIGLL
jgi:hypothetical protein